MVYVVEDVGDNAGDRNIADTTNGDTCNTSSRSSAVLALIASNSNDLEGSRDSFIFVSPNQRREPIKVWYFSVSLYENVGTLHLRLCSP